MPTTVKKEYWPPASAAALAGSWTGFRATVTGFDNQILKLTLGDNRVGVVGGVLQETRADARYRDQQTHEFIKSIGLLPARYTGNVIDLLLVDPVDYQLSEQVYIPIPK